MSQTTLQPVKVAYVPDECLPEGRWMIPLALDFSQNVTSYNGGATLVSQFIFSTRSIIATYAPSPIKGIIVEYFIAAANKGSILRITIQETQQEFYVGATEDYITAENVICVAQLPVLAPAICTITVQEIFPSGGGTNTDWAKIQLVNFEVEPSVASFGSSNMVVYPGTIV